MSLILPTERGPREGLAPHLKPGARSFNRIRVTCFLDAVGWQLTHTPENSKGKRLAREDWGSKGRALVSEVTVLK